MKHRDRALSGHRAALRALAGAPILVLGACEGFVELPGQGPPPRLFRLTPKSTFSEALPDVAWQLVVEVPSAPASLNTTRVAILRGATELDFYASANWIDRAPMMVQSLIVESFENSGHIVAVGRESLGLRSDFVLKTELREFQAEFKQGESPVVNAELNVRLVQMSQRAIIGYQRIGRVVPAASDRLEDIVVAFDEALGKVFKRLGEWVLIAGEEAHRRGA